jgi:diguanylate cyclase (GGDEF)-like protein
MIRRAAGGSLAWRRAGAGALAALLAPAAWLAVRAAEGVSPWSAAAGAPPPPAYFLLASLAVCTGFGALLGRHEERLLAANRALALLSVSDPVTGLKNARYFRARLAEAYAAAARTGAPLSVVVLDLDRFKAVNDRWGHPTGDRVLLAAAQAIGSAVRGGDTAAVLWDAAARVGGEEFALLLTGTGEDDARAVAERVREAVHAMRVPGPAGEEVRVTASAGVASARGDFAGGAQGLYAAADRAMYRAKEEGRDRVACAEAEAVTA